MVVPNQETNIVNNCASPNEGKQRLRERFQVIKKLGQGTYGKVQLAVNRETKQEVAIKTIRKAKIENEQDLLRIRREIQIMSSIQHPHIIHIYEVFENSDKIVLVMQYASGGELYDYLGCHKKLLEKEARRIFRQVAAAVYYCHKNKICHRDLKLENILLDDKGNAKIADFGLSNVFDERKKLRTFCGSPLYASPEIVKGTPYCGPEVDCWSLGVLLYTMVYGAMPFDGSNFKRLVKQISEGDYYEPKIKSKASGIIKRLLTVDVAARATIKDICIDEWVNETYDHSLLKVSNDMACLTPVSPNTLSHLHALESKAETRNSHPKNITLHRNYNVGQELECIMKRTQNELSKLNSIAGTLQAKTPFISSDNSDDILAPSNAVHSNNANLSGIDILNAKENSPKPVMTPASQNQICNFSGVSGDQNSVELTAPSSNQSQERNNFTPTANSIHLVSSETKKNEVILPQAKAEMLNNLKLETTACQGQNLRTKHVITDKDPPVPGNIPNCVKDAASHRRSTVEQFRAWRATFDQQKKNESDSILPIFDVTSVIPKRMNATIPEPHEKPICNGSKENSKYSSENTNDYCVQETHEMINNNVVTQTSQVSYGSVLDTTAPSRINEHKMTRERTEVIQFLSQACSQGGKISTELKRQFVSALTAQNNHDKRNDNNASTAPEETASCLKAELPHAETNKQLEESVVDEPGGNQVNLPGGKVQEAPSVEPLQETAENTTVTKQSIEEETLATETKNGMPNEDKNINIQPLSDEMVLTNVEQPCPIDKIPKAEEKKASVKNEEIALPESFTETFAEPRKVKETVQRRRKSVKKDDGNSAVINNRVNEVHSQNNANDLMHVQRTQQQRQSRSQSMKKLKTRSYSADNDNKMGDLERILRRPRKYSLCALLAASFELERLAAVRTRRYSESCKRIPGKIEIPRSFDPSSESEASTPVDKKDIILIPTVTVAENKQKIEKKIEKVKLSALSMKPRRKSEAGTRRKLKKYARSCTEGLNMAGLSNGQCTMYTDSNQLNGGYGTISDGNKTDSEIEYLYGDVRYLADEVEECFSAENVEFRNTKYVPITRCCKKITFPHKSVEFSGNSRSELNMAMNTNGHITDGSRSHEEPFDSSIQYEQMVEDMGGVNSENCLDAIIRNRILGNKYNQVNGNRKPLLNSDSWNSSSNDRDSSDNDDELDSISFDSKLEECESEDLWNFLKSINNNLSVRLKKAQKCPTKSKFSRSKSQECRSSENHPSIEKFFTRSRSKEEKHNSPNSPNSIVVSYSSMDTCESSSLSDFNQTPSKELIGSQANMNDEMLSDNPSRCSQNKNVSPAANLQDELFQNRAKKKFYSLSNLSDSQSFLHENNFCEIMDKEGLESSKAGQIPDEDSSEKSEVDKLSSDSSARTPNRTSIRLSEKMCKGKRSQSHLTLNGEGECGKLSKRHGMSSSHADFNKQGLGTNIAVRNKALSDLNISYREATCNSDFPTTLCSSDVKEKGALRFAKSLGSKLNLEPRSILLESSNKHQTMPSRSKKKDELLRKRGRKVSFIGDLSNEEHKNFALESLAKAQMALNNLEREYVADKPDEDKGTLLEALKTQGYKNIISQRLQQSEEDEEDELLNSRYSLAYLLKLKNYNIEGLPFDIHRARKILDHIQGGKRIQWNSNLVYPLEDVSNDYNELEYTDLLNLNGIYDGGTYQNADIHWSHFPNPHLYQSVPNFRTHWTANDESALPNWEEMDFNDWQPYRNSDKHYVSSSETFPDPIRTSTKMRENCAQKWSHATDFEPRAVRNTTSPMEKLSSKIKALKHRCHQKSLDESILNRGTSVDSEENFDSTVKNSEMSAGSESSDLDKPGESVSDRIWRKSFYSRFNETPTLRRRKSMLFEPDFSQNPMTLKSFNKRSTPDPKELPNRPLEKELPNRPFEKELLNRPLQKQVPNRPIENILGSFSFKDDRTVTKTYSKSDVVSEKEKTGQNIPNHTSPPSGEGNVVGNAMQEGE